MNSVITIINNEPVPREHASVLITDLAVQRGYGIFDFFKTISSKPVFLDDHLERLYHSAEYMRLPVQQTASELKTLISKLIEHNNIPDSGIRLTLTGGYSADGFNIGEPNLIITQTPLTLSKNIDENGIRLMSHKYVRQLSTAKTLDYTQAIWLQPIMKEQGADDILYYSDSSVTECPRSNFFIVTHDDVVVTASFNMLLGVIRKNVLDISKNKYVTEIRDVTLEEVLHAKEAFITSTTKNILPVVAIDGKTVGNGKPGEITRLLSQELVQVIYGG